MTNFYSPVEERIKASTTGHDQTWLVDLLVVPYDTLEELALRLFDIVRIACWIWTFCVVYKVVFVFPFCLIFDGKLLVILFLIKLNKK